MPVSSMTGFARRGLDFSVEEKRFSGFWEIKSVNGKSLDIKIKLPPLLEEISRDLKNIAAKYFCRGTINVFLELADDSENGQVKLNEKLLQTLVEKAAEIYLKNPDVYAKPQPEGLFSCPGVVEQAGGVWNEELTQKIKEVLLAEFEKLCADMKLSREQEGRKIKDALIDIAGKINIIVGQAEKIAGNLPALMREKLQKQLADWGAACCDVSEERLAQELVFYVTRADVREEIDRLWVHMQNFLQLLEENRPVGRKLDFLCQELNREANTTCSKSCDTELTKYGMELKTFIEQLREQVQNIE